MPKNVYEYAYELKVELYRKAIGVGSVILAFALAVSLLLEFVIFPVQVRSASMEPGIKASTSVFVSPLARSPSRGDVVLLKPLSSQKNGILRSLADNIIGFVTLHRFYPLTGSPSVSGNSCVRRVFAVPGDSIYMENYILYIRPAGESQYLTEYEVIGKDYEAQIDTAPAGWDTELGVVGSFEHITLGKDEYFVLCDNRNTGADSRMWGVIPASRIRGRVLFSYFPLSRIKAY